MVAKKPRIVIIGAGMAGLTAANKLYTSNGFKDLFELCVVEGGSRIGGRINTSQFGGDRIEMGATWIHGIVGSPIYKMAQELHSLESEQPWECMDGYLDSPTTMAEGGFELAPAMVDRVSTLFKKLMDFSQGKLIEDGVYSEEVDYFKLGAKASMASSAINGGFLKLSVGVFLRRGLDAYWASVKDREEIKGHGNWNRKLLEEAIFAMHENTQRTYTSAGDLSTLDYNAEREYIMFPGEEVTIAKGYINIIEALASVLPAGLIHLGRKVTKIEWQPEYHHGEVENGYGSRPVKLHFCDGSIMSADHVIVTVSLGVLKAGISGDSGLFSPPLPSFKTDAISRLGYGVVNKLFVQLSPSHDHEGKKLKNKFPFLQMVFHGSDSQLRNHKIPWWMRRTTSLCPIYNNSSVLLSWFAGQEALELEKMKDEEILNGVSATVTSLLSKSKSQELSSGNEVKFIKVLKSKWGSDPLFKGSYSYVRVGSSGEDLDSMAKPLPESSSKSGANGCPPLQILFAGEATHRTHYSTTHGAYFSGLREANRLLQHYNCVGVSELLQH